MDKDRLNQVLSELRQKESFNAKEVIRGDVYMEDNSGFICKDKKVNTNLSTKLVAQHINDNPESPIDYPRFCIFKTSAIDGSYGMHSKLAMVLDTDDTPTEDSKNLITSGTLYNIIQNLLSQIDDLKNSIDL